MLKQFIRFEAGCFFLVTNDEISCIYNSKSAPVVNESYQQPFLQSILCSLFIRNRGITHMETLLFIPVFMLFSLFYLASWIFGVFIGSWVLGNIVLILSYGLPTALRWYGGKLLISTRPINKYIISLIWLSFLLTVISGAVFYLLPSYGWTYLIGMGTPLIGIWKKRGYSIAMVRPELSGDGRIIPQIFKLRMIYHRCLL
jgi:hypothetical protein